MFYLDIKSLNHPGINKYLRSKQSTKIVCAGPLNVTADLVTQDMDEAEVLNAFFTCTFAGKTSFQESNAPETSRKVWSNRDLSLVKEDLIREYFKKLDRNKSTEHDGMHPQVLRELADVSVGPALRCWRKANVISSKRAKRRTQGNTEHSALRTCLGKQWNN